MGIGPHFLLSPLIVYPSPVGTAMLGNFLSSINCVKYPFEFQA